jgi:DNA-binding transcriptional ArsR family regulator
VEDVNPWIVLQSLAQQGALWRLRSPALRVFFYVAADLEIGQWRPIKQVRVARALGVGQQAVSRALAALVAAGYLKAGPAQGVSKTYRLNPEHGAVQSLYAA